MEAGEWAHGGVRVRGEVAEVAHLDGQARMKMAGSPAPPGMQEVVKKMRAEREGGIRG